MILYVLTILLLIYIIAKTLKEGFLNDKFSNEGNPVYGEEIHSTQHKVMLLFILVYTVITIISYTFFFVYFEGIVQKYLIPEYIDEFHNVMQGVRHYMTVKFSLLAYGWLVVINHFKQERVANTQPVNLFNIIKF